MAPWKGPRHESWASNFNFSLSGALAVIATYAVWDWKGTPPTVMTTLLGIAAIQLFAALSEETVRRRTKAKKELAAEKKRADQAEAKVAELEPDGQHE